MATNYIVLKQFKNALAICRNAWKEGPVHNHEVRVDLESQMLTAYTRLQQYELGRTLCDALVRELEPPLSAYKFDAWVSVGEYFLATNSSDQQRSTLLSFKIPPHSNGEFCKT